MPGQTQYMDTPVVPTSAFAGAGYNNPDCAYPDTTPAIREVDGDSGVGPWVSAAGSTLTITALGDQTVPNNALLGPSATPLRTTRRRHPPLRLRNGAAARSTIGGVAATLSPVDDSRSTVHGARGRAELPDSAAVQYGGPHRAVR